MAGRCVHAEAPKRGDHPAFRGRVLHEDQHATPAKPLGADPCSGRARFRMDVKRVLELDVPGKVVCKPAVGRDMPDALLSRWEEALKDGARGKLLMLPSSNPK